MADGPQVVQTDEFPESYKNDKTQAAPFYDHAQPHMVNGHDHAPYEHDAQSKHATILGLRRRNFWILTAFAIVILGATIGGSIGGSLAVRNKSTSPTPLTTAPSNASSTASSAPSGTQSGTAFILPALTSTSTINVTCPSSRLSSITDSNVPNTYSYECHDSSNAADGNSNIMSFTAYSLQQCVDACSQYNYRAGSGCKGIVIQGNVGRSSRLGNGANCWLKNNTSPLKGTAGEVTVALLL